VLQRLAKWWANNPKFREAETQRAKERYANNPELREAAYLRRKERDANDPEYRQATLQRERGRYANDPEYRAPEGVNISRQVGWTSARALSVTPCSIALWLLSVSLYSWRPCPS
jgi:hypothetical protein